MEIDQPIDASATEATILDGLAGTRPAGAGITGAAASYVSLFLLLLVFFIVLFSISSVQQSRSHQILTSIDQAFGHLPSRLGLITAKAPHVTTGSPVSQDVASLLSDFTSENATAKASLHDTDLLLDSKKLFADRTITLAPEAIANLGRLAVVLQRQGAEARRGIVIDIPRNGSRALHDLALHRASTLITELYRQGCPPNLLALGSAELPQDVLRIRVAIVDGEDADAASSAVR